MNNAAESAKKPMCLATEGRNAGNRMIRDAYQNMLDLGRRTFDLYRNIKAVRKLKGRLESHMGDYDPILSRRLDAVTGLLDSLQEEWRSLHASDPRW